MKTFEEIDRPPKNRRSIHDDLAWDRELEAALRATQQSGKAVIVPLARFHSSPAKGRLWKAGLKVHHRVCLDREHVAAWVDDAPQA